jgi:flagellin-like protein
MKKAITPVIAIVLLLMMTVAAAGFAYVFLKGTQEEVQKGTGESVEYMIKELSSCMSIDSISGNKIYLRNCGKGVITNDSLSFYIDGVPYEHTLTGSIGEGEVGDVTINYPIIISAFNIRSGDKLKIISVMGSVVTSLNQYAQNKISIDFYESFDQKDTSAWTYNTHQTVPYDDNGNNVVKNVGTNTNWGASFYRKPFILSHGDMAIVEFKVDAGDTVAHFTIRADDTTYRRWGMIANGNKIYVQYNDGGGWKYPKDLINPALINTWYVAMFKVDDTNGFYMKVVQKNNPSIYGEYTRNMPTGKNWRFRHWIWRNTAYLDNYIEAH